MFLTTIAVPNDTSRPQEATRTVHPLKPNLTQQFILRVRISRDKLLDPTICYKVLRMFVVFITLFIINTN